jgi:plastocyanin domain-containing protein
MIALRKIFVPLLASGLVFLALAGCEGDAPQQAADSGRVEITVGDAGYSPTQVRATQGEPLTMVFTRTSESICGETVLIPEHDIERKLPVNEPVEITFTPARTGRLAFMCGMKHMQGAIIVQ